MLGCWWFWVGGGDIDKFANRHLALHPPFGCSLALLGLSVTSHGGGHAASCNSHGCGDLRALRSGVSRPIIERPSSNSRVQWCLLDKCEGRTSCSSVRPCAIRITQHIFRPQHSDDSRASYLCPRS